MIVEREFMDHWKTELLVAELGEEGAVRCLLRLWAHCEAQRQDTFTGLDRNKLAAICRWKGNAAKFEKALLKCRWIDRDGETLHVRGWRDRNRKLLASIENGRKGGRPAKPANPQPTGEPNGNPRVSSGLSQTNLLGTIEWSGVELSIPPIVPQGGHGEVEGRESKVEGAAKTPPDRDRISGKKERGGGGDQGPGTRDQGESVSVMLETWGRIRGLFGRSQVHLPYETQQQLAELERNGVLPLSEEDWTVLEWWFRLPKEEKDSDLRSRRQHAESLAGNLLSELERARGYAKKVGENFAAKKEGGGLDEEALRAWCAERGYPAAWSSVSELPGDLVREYRREVAA